MNPDLIVSSRRAMLPEGEAPASIVVSSSTGTIEAVLGYDPTLSAERHVDVRDRILMPGIIDVHVHVNDPGREEWEGFSSATRAAAAGGITTVVDMPLNSSPVTISKNALEEKVKKARGRCVVDHGFWGGVVPGNAGELRDLWDAGVLGFKCFLCPSGLPEFGPVSCDDLRAAMTVLQELDAVLLVHAESPKDLRELQDLPEGADPTSYQTYLASRPVEAELRAIRDVIDLSRATGCRVHIVHLSSGEGIGLIEQARREGIRITVETCPHYLFLTAEEIKDGATQMKCAPPIRELIHREMLWKAIAGKDIDLLATDHSPCLPGLKLLSEGDFFKAWGGIASIQLFLPLVHTEAQSRGIPTWDLQRLLTRAPSKLAGLEARKGLLAPGKDADFVVWDPDSTFVVRGEELEHRHPLTPYEGRTLSGRVLQTWLRGKRVYDDGSFVSFDRGNWLRREASWKS